MYIYIVFKIESSKEEFAIFFLYSQMKYKNRVKAITIPHTISIPIIRVHYTVTLSMITLKGWPNCKSFDPLSYMFPNI